MSRFNWKISWALGALCGFVLGFSVGTTLNNRFNIRPNQSFPVLAFPTDRMLEAYGHANTCNAGGYHWPARADGECYWSDQPAQRDSK